MTIKESITNASEATCRETLEYILCEFSKPAFGALPKKEIELLILEGLVRIGYLDDEPSLYELIQLLRVSRSKSRSLIYERDLRRLGNAELDRLLVAALTKPHIMKQGDLFSLETPGFRKDVTPLIRTSGGLMERINASLQRGRQG